MAAKNRRITVAGENGATVAFDEETEIKNTEDITTLSGFLTRDQILGASDAVTEIVDVPEWGGKVIVKALSGIERDKLEASMIQGRGSNKDVNLTNLRAKLVALSVIDEKGARVFRDEDSRPLGNRNAAVLDRIYSVAQRLSGITKEDAEELAKNSESDQSDDSTLS